MPRLLRFGIMFMGLAALVSYVDHRDYTKRLIAEIGGDAVQERRIGRQLSSLEQYLHNHPTQGEAYRERIAELGTDIMQRSPLEYEEEVLALNRSYVSEGGTEAALNGYRQLAPQMQRELLYRGAKQHITDTTSSAYQTIRDYMDEISE